MKNRDKIKNLLKIKNIANAIAKYLITLFA